MTKNEAFRGTGNVLRFTLTETFKSRANLVSFVILILFALAAYPLIILTGGWQSNALSVPEMSENTVLKLENQTALPLDAAQIDLSGIPGLNGEIVCRISQNGDGAYVVTPLPQTACEEETLVLVAQATAAEIQKAELLQNGVSQQTVSVLTRAAEIQIEQEQLDSYVRRANGELGMDEKFAIQYGYALIAMFLCLYSTIYIIRAIAEEKASRLMETLLVSVKPMALICGKILAVIIYIVCLFTILVVSFLLSAFITPMFMDAPRLSDILAVFAPQLSAIHLGFDTLLVAIISLLFGYAFVAVMGGLAGACCSESEDIQSANSAVTFVVMAGYLVSCFTGAIGSGVVAVILSLCPVVSIFTAPVLFVSGAIPFYVLLISWGIQAGLVLWLFRFTGRLYADMLIYRGTRLKLRDLLRMSKQIKQSKAINGGGEAQ